MQPFKPYLQISLIYLICVFIIVAYGTFRCKTTSFTDPLTFTIAPPPLDKYLDGWGISHLLFFALLGYLYPQYIWFSFVLGVLWELLEYSFKSHPFYLSGCKYNMTTHKGEGWWYGRWQDIVMNSIGLLCGYAIAKRI